MTRDELLEAARNLTPLMLSGGRSQLCFAIEEGAAPGWWRVQCIENPHLCSCGGEALRLADAMDLHRFAEFIAVQACGRPEDYGNHSCSYCQGVNEMENEDKEEARLKARSESEGWDVADLGHDPNWRRVFREAVLSLSDVLSVAGAVIGRQGGGPWVAYGQLKDGGWFYLTAEDHRHGWKTWSQRYSTQEAVEQIALTPEDRRRLGMLPLPGVEEVLVDASAGPVTITLPRALPDVEVAHGLPDDVLEAEVERRVVAKRRIENLKEFLADPRGFIYTPGPFIFGPVGFDPEDIVALLTRNFLGFPSLLLTDTLKADIETWLRKILVEGEGS